MAPPTWLPAACALALWGCGPLEVRSYTYEATDGGKPGPTVALEPTRTHETGWGEELRHQAPYRVVVSVNGDDADKPFEVVSLSYEHEGKTTVVHAASAAPLESEPGDPKATTKRMVVRVPADDLRFVDGSTVDIKAQLRLAGATTTVAVERTLSAKKEEKSYSACQRISMH